MTTDQLTHEVMTLKENQAKSQAEHERFEIVIKEIQEDVKTTKTLAEDVHIMAINMENMQKTLNETNKKVDALTSQEFLEYKENKKIIRQNIINKLVGFGIGIILTIIAFKLGLQDYL